MIDVIDLVFDPDFCETVTVRRTPGSFNSYGEWVDGTTSTFTVIGSWQRVTEKELNQLDFGEIKQEMRKLITNTELKMSEDDARRSDRIIYQGRRYKVIKVTDTSNFGYWRVYVAWEGDE